MTPDIAPYWVALEAFIDGKLSADEFETIYLRLFTNDPTRWPDEVYEALNQMFFYVDAYWGGDPALSDSETINGDQLRERASQALGKLRGVQGQS